MKSSETARGKVRGDGGGEADMGRQGGGGG